MRVPNNDQRLRHKLSCELRIPIMNNLPWQSKLPDDVGEKQLSNLPHTKSRLTNRARNEAHKLGQMVNASEDCVMTQSCAR